MSSEDFIEVNGTIEELLPSTNFKVKLEDGRIISSYLSGNMRRNRIKLTVGDEVKIQISPYDLEKGRIVYRY
jgi:translation initiation factor IF-1